MALFQILLLSMAIDDQALRIGAVGERQQQAGVPGLGMADAERPDILAQMTIEQRVIIRVPMARPPVPGPPPERFAREMQGDGPPVNWGERKGPKCIDINRLMAASIASSRGVDLMLRGRERIRALLGRGCRTEDLYSGFYIQPNSDGALCANRDRVLARSGADCPITSLKRLVPEP